MHRLLLLNKLRWPLRIPVKAVVLALTALVVCFPFPNLLVRHLGHLRDPDSLIEPDAAVLEPLVDELRPMLGADLSPTQALKTVERFVYDKLPYAWDWHTWGNADYLPTVTEALAKGQEDCDGQAVVAASLLRRFGFETQLVTDFAHVWVKTDKGETMGPGRRQAVVATPEGLRLQPGALAELGRAAGLGLAVFPLGRELIVLFVLWFLLLRAGGGTGCALVALILLLDGLLFVREGSASYQSAIIGMQFFGVANFAAALVALLGWGRVNPRAAARAPVPSSQNGRSRA